ncbi:hypothetical protein EI427_01275 [Flammeovirga pectinis]|uniref:Lipoprotein n=1 Tax=Flammeovirga pectinis TaxID=2494373 RepID=A0A3S9NY47_9BACT|nr:HmuY family protein [Flammeovirga pectinis]AZQ60890.1 hypothetical protein EI427_01275 [Flammeovirga pectinis]
MKKLVTLFIASLFITACTDDNNEPSVPEDTSSHEIQVALYSTPDVEVEMIGHDGQPAKTKLSYNRQVFVDLDAATETTNADTLGYHWNDAKYTHFDLWETGKDVAEGSQGWDLALAYYNGKTLDPSSGTEVPYMMTGGLINKGEVKAIRLNKEEIEAEGQTFVAYNNITYADANKLSLNEDVDAIGSDWKALDFATFTYQIVADQYYIIESSDQKLYKLAFTGFYSDEDGTKGFPKFKFQRLIAE